MKWLSNNCGHYRESLCLLASGILAGGEIADIENHLATCTDCRKYYDQLRNVVAPLAGLEKAFSHIEPNQAVQARWDADFQRAIHPVGPHSLRHIVSFLDWFRDMIWPCRRVWIGFAGVWLVIFVVNLSSMRGFDKLTAGSSLRVSTDIVQAFVKNEDSLAGELKPRPSAKPDA